MRGEEHEARVAAFAELRRLERQEGPLLPWEVIARGFLYAGRRYAFANRPRGIFRPEGFPGDAALSIKSTEPREGRSRRYNDVYGSTDAFIYRLQGEDPSSRDNRALYAAYRQRLPLIWFWATAPGVYLPLWPVFTTTWEPDQLRCIVEVRPSRVEAEEVAAAAESIPRRYREVSTLHRMHQAAFRQKVLTAYQQRCAICQMPSERLLEAAHIVPDVEEAGEATVPNGLALCKLHHGAFDSDLLGITPDARVALSGRLTRMTDGPVFHTAFIQLRGAPLHLPRRPSDHPSPALLAQRYEHFLKAEG